jgi:hypothetical protein
MNKNKRRVWHSLVATILLGVVSGLLQPKTATAETGWPLDQEQTTEDGGNPVGSSLDGAGMQVFTAGPRSRLRTPAAQQKQQQQGLYQKGLEETTPCPHKT